MVEERARSIEVWPRRRTARTARAHRPVIGAYLNFYRAKPRTLRAYTKELERFLLWTVAVSGKALSSLLVDDWETYKDLPKQPSPAFVGPRAPQISRRWHPFAADSLSPESQLYAASALRAVFT